MSTLIDTVQLQSIDDSIIYMYEVTLQGQTSPAVYLTTGLDESLQNIYFPNQAGNALNEYVAIPMKMEKAEQKADGPDNRPKLLVANLVTLGRTFGDNADGDSDENTWSQILESNAIYRPEDICGATIVERSTLFKNTYRVGDTPALPVEFPKRKYVLDRVIQETNMYVTYELVSPFDLERVTLPARKVIGKYCPWKYQGLAIDADQRSGCTWSNTSAQEYFFDIDDNQIYTNSTDNPKWKGTWNSGTSYGLTDQISYTVGTFIKIWECITPHQNKLPIEGSRYWKRIDICGKTLNSCKVRYQGPATDEQGLSQTINRLTPLPFGGFPGSRKFGN
jgi:phage-related protein